MSEFGQHYRVHGWTEDDFEHFLEGLDGYTIAPFTEEPSMRTLFETGTDGASDGRNTFHITSSPKGWAQLSFWNLDLDAELIAKLAEQKKTFLNYAYHTGAGFDELKIHVGGEEALTEDLGEGYYFQCGDVAMEISYDFDYEPNYDAMDEEPYDESAGWSNKLQHDPARAPAIENLANEMGEAVVIIEGWEKLAREDWPLSYLSDLDW